MQPDHSQPFDSLDKGTTDHAQSSFAAGGAASNPSATPTQFPSPGSSEKRAKKYYSSLDLPHPSQIRVLAVDDTPGVLSWLSVVLGKNKYQVATANNASEALKLFDEFGPDVLLIDFMMPGMDGLKLAETIRARRDLLYIPIVMLTGVDDDEVRLSSLENGVDAYLAKPIKIRELKITLGAMLRLKMAQDRMLAALERVSEVQDELLEFERKQGQSDALHKTLPTYTRQVTQALSQLDQATANLKRMFGNAKYISGSGGTDLIFATSGLNDVSQIEAASTQIKKALKELES